MATRKQSARNAKKNDAKFKAEVDGVRLSKFQEGVLVIYKDSSENGNEEKRQERIKGVEEFVFKNREEERESTARVLIDQLPSVSDYRSAVQNEKEFSRPTEPLEPQIAVPTVHLESKFELENAIALQNAELKKLHRHLAKVAKQRQELALALSKRAGNVIVDDSGLCNDSNVLMLQSLLNVEIL